MLLQSILTSVSPSKQDTRIEFNYPADAVLLGHTDTTTKMLKSMSSYYNENIVENTTQQRFNQSQFRKWNAIFRWVQIENTSWKSKEASYWNSICADAKQFVIWLFAFF